MDRLYDWKGNTIDITDESLSLQNVPADSYAVGERFKDIDVLGGQNCKIIAHPGYHVVAHENTVEACIEAHNNGFSWIEIDMRPTSDGVYVLAHNAKNTLYNNGTSVYIDLSESNYADVAGYTWDKDGKYPLATLQGAFNAIRLFDMSVICDRKAGANADIIQIAAKGSALNKILLSYPTFAAAYAERDLLNKYPYIPIRVWPGDPENVEQLRSVIHNPIYADTNVQGLNNYTFSTPLSFGIPFIFSGCELRTKDIWAPLASGCMAATENISFLEFKEALDIDVSVPIKITSGQTSIAVAAGETVEASASSDGKTMAGNVYGYTEDMSIARVKQKTFGLSVSMDIVGIKAGQTNLVLFTISGAIVKIPVVVN